MERKWQTSQWILFNKKEGINMNILANNLLKQGFDLMCQIEKFPASELQTKTVIMADDLTHRIEEIFDRLNRANQFAEDVTDFNKSAFIYNEVQDLMGKLGYAVNPHIHKGNPDLAVGTQKGSGMIKD
jgi:hypothetical protein